MDSGHHAYTRFPPAGVVARSPRGTSADARVLEGRARLAWGNTVVLKPARTPRRPATLMARLAVEAGLPPGVLNVLHGYGQVRAGPR